jgi:hypothetical protein
MEPFMPAGDHLDLLPFRQFCPFQYCFSRRDPYQGMASAMPPTAENEWASAPAAPGQADQVRLALKACPDTNLRLTVTETHDLNRAILLLERISFT